MPVSSRTRWLFRVCASLLLVGSLVSSSIAQSPCVWSSVAGGFAGPPGTNAQIATTVVHDDGTGAALYVGGVFATVGTTSVDGVARFDGSNWSAVGGVATSSSNVDDLAVFDDGTGPALYAASASPLGVRRLSGASWVPVGPPGFFGSGGRLASFDDGSGPALFAYSRGYFGNPATWVGGGIQRWDGVNWTLSPNVGRVTDMAVYDDGSGPALYAVGSELWRWDGATWVSQFVFPPPFAYPDAVGKSLAVFDDGFGPLLYIGTSPAVGISRWDGSTLMPLPPPGISDDPRSLTVFDDGSGPALYVNGVVRWNGVSWSSAGGTAPGPGVSSTIVFDDGTGPSLYAGRSGFTGGPGSWSCTLDEWSCSSTLSIAATQSGPGAPVSVQNANLITGNEYYNLFSLDACPTGPGTGSGPFGACFVTQANQAFLTAQLLMPLGGNLFHFLAPGSAKTWGPFTVPPILLDALCIDVTGGTLGPVSPVIRITTQ